MGPAGNNDLPSRPRFSWDIRTTPWTDVRGIQETFARSVKLWCQFHDKLPDSNSNKIQNDLRVICLKSQLFGRTYDLCPTISDADIMGADGATKIVSAIHVRDSLSVTNQVYSDFNQLMSVKRGPSESYQSYENKFAAQVATFSAHSKKLAIHESLLGMMLLSGSNVDDDQRIPILSSACSSVEINDDYSIESVITQITYEKVASVLRQCDSKTGKSYNNDTYIAYSANVLNKPRQPNSRGGRPNSSNKGQARPGRNQMSPNELRAFQLKTQCTNCHNYGHWHTDHLNNGTIRDVLPSFRQQPDAQQGLRPGQRGNQNNNGDRNDNGNRNRNSNRNDNQNILNFMSSLACSNAASEPSIDSGPLVDYDAPFSSIGMTELCLLFHVNIDFQVVLDRKPPSLSSYLWWQFGTGTHSSPRRRILGSVNLTVDTDHLNTVRIRHLFIEWSSQWVVGRNVTRSSDVLHYSGSRILLPPVNGFLDSIGIRDNGLHSFISLSKFGTAQSSSAVLSGSSAAATVYSSRFQSWSQTKRIVDRVHKHTSGHSTYSDIRTLLQRNRLWSDEVQHYLGDVIRRCTPCVASSTPSPSRKVTIGTLNRHLNDVVMIDHFYLDQLRLFHCMDSHTRFSSVYLVPDASVFSATLAFETTWIAQFWPPLVVQGIQAFANREFTEFLSTYDTKFRPVTARKHHKNPLEPKHGVIRSILIRLKEASPDINISLLGLLAVTISNDLYGSEVMSSFEISKGFTKPLLTDMEPVPIPEDFITARDTPMAKRKLNLIMRTKITTDPVINSGDMVQVYVQNGNEKRGKWSSPRIVLDTNLDSGTVTVPGSRGHKITASFEYTRVAIIDDDLASSIQESVDLLDEYWCRNRS